MWPFTRRKNPTTDPLTFEVDLGPLGPFHEVDMYLLVWRNALAQSYGLTVVYEGRRGDRVHVVHSPGYEHGGAMETHGEWLGTEVRRRDPAAVALFLVWPAETSSFNSPEAELIRVWFTLNPTGTASPSQTILMSEGNDGPVLDNVFTKPGECLYDDMHYGHPRQGPAYWSKVLGCPVTTFTPAEWAAAADQVDPGRAQRADVEQASADAMADQIAFLKEHGLYGDEPAPASDEIAQPSPAQRDRLMSRWAQEPDADTAQASSFSIGGANLGHPTHPAPVVGFDLPPEALEQLPIDLTDFKGPDTPPPAGRRIRLWDETLLTVEEPGRWRLIAYLERDLLPQWWFDAAAEDGSDAPHGVIILRIAAEPTASAPTSIDLNELDAAVSLAHLEDCRDID